MKKYILAAFSVALFCCACNSKDERISIAILTPVNHPSLEQIEKGFIQTLGEQNYRFVTYNGQGNKTLLRSEIDEIAQTGFDLVLTIGTTTTQMAAEVFRKKEISMPIVFTAVNDPLGLGLIDSEESPGGNITGVKEEVHFREELDAFLSHLSHLSKILLVYNPMEAGLQKDAQEIETLLNQKNIDLKKVEVFKTNEIKSKVSSQLSEANAILVLKDNTVVAGLDILSKVCLENKIPLLASDLDSPEKGAAMGYGVSESEFGVEAAKKALLVFEESRSPGTIPVTAVGNFILKIDREVAEKQGISFKEELQL